MSTCTWYNHRMIFISSLCCCSPAFLKWNHIAIITGKNKLRYSRHHEHLWRQNSLRRAKHDRRWNPNKLLRPPLQAKNSPHPYSISDPFGWKSPLWGWWLCLWGFPVTHYKGFPSSSSFRDDSWLQRKLTTLQVLWHNCMSSVRLEVLLGYLGPTCLSRRLLIPRGLREKDIWSLVILPIVR